jgi:dihydrofolate reductase
VIISLIVAMDQARGIGINNRIPWHISKDLKRFKHLTMGHHLIMGRKTYDSIGHPLAGRVSIVLTRNPQYTLENALVSYSLNEALRIAEAGNDEEVFIIGGGEIFEISIPIADRVYLTEVHCIANCDTFFAELNSNEWAISEISYHLADDKNQFAHSFQILNRMKPPC